LEVNANVTATVNALTFRYAKCDLCSGAGIWNKGNLTVTNSTFRDNDADNIGGGIFNEGALNISNSTFTNNDAGVGGAIGSSNGSLTMTNVTVANNTSAVVGGVFSATAVTINNTVSSNNSGGNCSTPFNNTGANNITSDSTCGATFTQKTVAEINLQGIADNGGSAFTMALLYPSAALDAGSNTVCANAPINNLDQRGQARPQRHLPKPPRGEPQLNDNASRERYAKLKEWRKQRAEARGVESDVIVSNDALIQVARAYPKTLKDLETIAELGEWKAREYGEELLKILNGNKG